MKKSISVLIFLCFITNPCLGFLQKQAKPMPLSPATKRESSNSLIGNTQQTQAMAFSADMEAEVLTTMAHFTMDFSMFANPSKHLLRYFAVLGRVMVISADYIIDHSIHPEELMIQLFLISMAVKEIIFDNPVNSNETK